MINLCRNSLFQVISTVYPRPKMKKDGSGPMPPIAFDGNTTGGNICVFTKNSGVPWGDLKIGDLFIISKNNDFSFPPGMWPVCDRTGMDAGLFCTYAPLVSCSPGYRVDDMDSDRILVHLPLGKFPTQSQSFFIQPIAHGASVGSSNGPDYWRRDAPFTLDWWIDDNTQNLSTGMYRCIGLQKPDGGLHRFGQDFSLLDLRCLAGQTVTLKADLKQTIKGGIGTARIFAGFNGNAFTYSSPISGNGTTEIIEMSIIIPTNATSGWWGIEMFGNGGDRLYFNRPVCVLGESINDSWFFPKPQEIIYPISKFNPPALIFQSVTMPTTPTFDNFYGFNFRVEQDMLGAIHSSVAALSFQHERTGANVGYASAWRTSESAPVVYSDHEPLYTTNTSIVQATGGLIAMGSNGSIFHYCDHPGAVFNNFSIDVNRVIGN